MATQVQAFLQENSQAIRELRNLEMIRLNRYTPLNTARNAAMRIYAELLENFKSTFPRITTTTLLLYWGFIRTRIAGLHLETGDRTQAYEVLMSIVKQANAMEPVYSLLEKLRFPEKFQPPNSLGGAQLTNSDMLMLNIFAGLLQNTFNLLAASLSVPTETNISADSSALHWLHSAKRVHELYLIQNPENIGPTFWETIQFRECVESLGENIPNGEAESEMSPERLLFEHGYTSTIFLLAQAYQLANEPDHAASYCQLTLSRQITFARPYRNLLRVFGPLDRRKRSRAVSARRSRDAITEGMGLRRRPVDCLSAAFQPFDRIEWASNATSLGRYYETVGLKTNTFYSALECHTSALAILDEIGPQPQLSSTSCTPAADDKTGHFSTREQRIRANIYRSLAEMFLNLLDLGVQALQSTTKQSDDSDITSKVRNSNAAKDFGSMFQLDLRAVLDRLSEGFVEETTDSSALSDEHCFSAHQNSINGPAMHTEDQNIADTLSTVPSNYHSASRLFRAVSYAISQAEHFYTMEERCSDAVELVQSRSKAYRMLAAFESTRARQCRMHKRRVDMITRVLKPLNRQHYQHVCRQLLFELAETLSTMRDLKQEIHDELVGETSKAPLHYARKANQLAKRAVATFDEFLATFGRSPGQNTKIRKFTEDEIRPVMLAHFYSARLHSRIIAVNPNEQIRSLSRALSGYRAAVSVVENHLQRHPRSSIQNAEELSIARDMCNLLPVRLSRLVRGEPIGTVN
ncbi:hypothetical protein D915_009143 [Fasciola hepatica]|uniref:KIF-binding protein n=1 Tax=Fasciola hepatica TaxID=6192 RepID=A0A2H1BYB7_FASHE|nr:hypothetical protein D915_009143 [Fasciola hepatica]